MTPALMLRLNIESMRYQVVHAFMDHSTEIEEEISKALDAPLKDFDFVAVVKAEADRALREAVKSAVVHAVASLTYEEPIASMIKDGARAKVKQAVMDALKETK
jgi:hypothetical protein